MCVACGGDALDTILLYFVVLWYWFCLQQKIQEISSRWREIFLPLFIALAGRHGRNGVCVCSVFRCASGAAEAELHFNILPTNKTVSLIRTVAHEILTAPRHTQFSLPGHGEGFSCYCCDCDAAVSYKAVHTLARPTCAVDIAIDHTHMTFSPSAQASWTIICKVSDGIRPHRTRARVYTQRRIRCRG